MDKKLPSPNFSATPKEANCSVQTKVTKNFLMPGLAGSGIPQQNQSPEPSKGPIFEFAAPKAPITKQLHVPQKSDAPHFSSPDGMLMPSSMQPPPMYGPRGPTIPPQHLPGHKKSHRKEQDEFWCDVCDICFVSSEDLNKHKSEHKVCGVDGCSFFGGTSTLASHLESIHTSGLYNKVKKLSTPEEISKWRAERKKKYPTSANVELRRKFQEARMKRGEKIDEKKSRFGRKADRRPMRNQTGGPDQKIVLRKPKANFMKGKKTEVPKVVPKVVEKIVSETDVEPLESLFNRELPAFKGTALLEDYNRPKAESAKYNPLANLLGMYGSDDDGTDSDAESCEETGSREKSLTKCASNTEEVIKKQVEPSVEEFQTNRECPSGSKSQSFKEMGTIVAAPELPANIASSDDEMPEEIPAKRIKENIEEPPQKTAANQPKPPNTRNTRKRSRQRRNNNTEEAEARGKMNDPKPSLLNYSKLRRGQQNTMLEKLLEPNIRHERNVLLQCVRYVVENNFFGIGGNQPS